MKLRTSTIIVLALGITFSVAAGTPPAAVAPAQAQQSIPEHLLAWGAALADGNGRVITGFEDTLAR